MANDPLEDIGLAELGNRNEYLKSQIEGANKLARGTGGFGTNKSDELAREFDEKQRAVEGEIFDRLANKHEDRSNKAQVADESKRAEIAPSPEVWADDPNNWDWPGIDTPER